MFYLGLLLPILYIPGITGTELLPQWALLSLWLPLILTRAPPKAYLVWFAFGGFGFFLSLHWVTWLFGLWTLTLWGLSFQLGRELENPVPLLRGLAFGLAINSVICILQWLGWIVLYQSGAYAGLMFNNGVLSVACGFVIVALAQYQQQDLIPLLLPALFLAYSRAGWFAIAIAIAAKIHWLVPFALLALCGFLTNHITDPVRLEVWGITLRCLTFLGHGAGSFADLFYIESVGQIVHPEYVHNDYLQLVYEYGAFAIIPFACVGLALWRASPLVYAAAATALVEPVLYNPLPAFILCLALGLALHDFNLRSLSLHLRRSSLLPWLSRNQALDRGPLPLHMDPPQSEKGLTQ